MAKKNNGPSKSQSIRDYLTANPESKAKDVVEALGKTGVRVNEGLVYAVKGSMKERTRRKRRVAHAAMAATSSQGKMDAITLIREVRALADKTGGYANLKELVDALAD